jgi:hypothetical protein
MHDHVFVDYANGQYVQRHEAVALIPNAAGQPVNPGTNGRRYFHLSMSVVAYGYLDAAQRVPAAAASFLCDNNGGTADGQELSSIGVYTVVGGGLRMAGLITPQQQPANGIHVTLLDQPRMSAGRVTVHEIWYGPSDGTCCPTGRAESTWVVKDGRLVYASTRVTARPH